MLLKNISILLDYMGLQLMNCTYLLPEIREVNSALKGLCFEISDNESEGEGSMDELPVVPSEGDSASSTEDESPLSKR